MAISRRTFFRGALVLTAGAAVGCSESSSTSTSTEAAAPTTQAAPKGYDGDARPLPIPPLLEGEVVDGTRVFRMTAQDGYSEILPGITTTRTWGFNGDFLGPTLRAHKGERVRAEITNDLIEMTTVHWHGMKLPAYSDGGPHSPIEPGKTWTPEWDIVQPAATVWYHPHPHMATATHAYRGLAGMFIIDDDVSDQLDLPRDYGVDDIPVVIMDAKFTDDGQLDHKVHRTLGLMGDTPLVNGITNARFEATTRRVRLRLLNGASMRFYNLALSDGASFTVIATDVGLLDAPVTTDTLVLGPGERAEVLVDLAPGAETTLQAVPFPDNFGIPQGPDYTDFGFQDSFDLLQLVGTAGAADASAADAAAAASIPAVLDPAAKAPAVPSGPGVRRREFVLNTFMINGQHMDMARVDTVIDHDGPEVWTVTNENPDWPHNFHIHDCRFWVLEHTAAEQARAVAGWKDIVNLPPGSTATLLVEFGHFPDATIPYMYHCHMLLHEDRGMMGQFVIVNKGEQPDVRVQPAALVFEKQPGSGRGGGHGGHGGQVVDSSRSPYATPTAGETPQP